MGVMSELWNDKRTARMRDAAETFGAGYERMAESIEDGQAVCDDGRCAVAGCPRPAARHGGALRILLCPAHLERLRVQEELDLLDGTRVELVRPGWYRLHWSSAHPDGRS